MKRLFLTIILGVSLASFAYGQDVQRDTTQRVDSTKVSATIDSSKTAVTVKDSISVQPIDSLAIRPDTTARLQPMEVDTTAAAKDTTRHEGLEKEQPTSGLQSLPNAASSYDPNGYKDAHWGTTLQDIRNYLVDHDNVDEYSIRDITNGFEYSTAVAGTKCKVAYQFDNDRLFIVRLTPQVQASSKFDYLDSFDDYQSTLESKYGKPSRSGFHKNDESYLNTIESIQLGFAKKYSLWEFERSYIVLVLTGNNGRLEIHITYLSHAIFDEMRNRIETLKLEDF